MIDAFLSFKPEDLAEVIIAKLGLKNYGPILVAILAAIISKLQLVFALAQLLLVKTGLIKAT